MHRYFGRYAAQSISLTIRLPFIPFRLDITIPPLPVLALPSPKYLDFLHYAQSHHAICIACSSIQPCTPHSTKLNLSNPPKKNQKIQ
ncbi:hypothetical protein EYC84_000487 [Monilinia fructicola]|uniref:Uncharacterized protein n=1 Tax=Monilinia fructicola TaxID=38448 RepID=A0A5M9JTL9_MONFR|nr:hypothetical protein EYC84_000487 [Monilinia fructicola]